MSFCFYFCTKSSTPKQTLTYQSLLRIRNIVTQEFDISFAEKNSTGLSKNYNNFLLENKSKYDYIIFLHDDIIVDDARIFLKLTEYHKKYDIVGLAGGINAAIKAPALWHLMCGGFGSGNLRGAVAHTLPGDKIAMTSFGPTPDRVVVLDGLFLSVNTNTVGDWKFNENYDFHHYDIASSIDANRKKLKLGVVPIWVIHSSPGLRDINDTSFNASQEKFLKEYSSI